jgi:lipopolysaccharide/colanic/teichoic acid biosynthesis glycosyltransferase
MSALTSSSMPTWNPALLDSAVSAPHEGSLPSSLPVRTEGLAAERPRYLIKRALDLTGAMVGLVLLAPVLLAVALWIRLDSPGPILFRQARRGLRGRPFQVLKFRTMVVDAEQRLGSLESRNESRGGVLFKLHDDPRVTRLGRFLRRSSLDELPQLINVLKGEMSLVGPRPLQLRDCDRLWTADPEGFRRRLQVPPGITGPWQVGGRSDADYQRMVQLDLDYAENWSLSRDLRIVGKTVLVVLFRLGAY